MATYSFVALDEWVRKAKNRINAVLKQATNDMINGVGIVSGLSRGGFVQKGAIPRDLGTLARSLQSTLYGSTAINATGEDSWIGVVGSIEGGDVAAFSWGGDEAPYARRIHYGWGSYPGTFFRDEATAKWQSYIETATARAKREFP